MTKSIAGKHKSADEISDADIIRIVTDRLPHWKVACDNGKADMVILQQRAFGRSDDELLLLALAIKYAGIAKRDVMIGA